MKKDNSRLTGSHKALLYTKLDLLRIRPPRDQDLFLRREPIPILDAQTLQQLDSAAEHHRLKADRIKARKRYKVASDKQKAAIDEAICERRLRRLKALWDPE